MSSLSKKINAYIFILLIFTVGIATLYNARSDVKAMLRGEAKNGYRATVENSILNNFAKRTGWINLNGLFNRLTFTTVVRDKNDVV